MPTSKRSTHQTPCAPPTASFRPTPSGSEASCDDRLSSSQPYAFSSVSRVDLGCDVDVTTNGGAVAVPPEVTNENLFFGGTRHGVGFPAGFCWKIYTCPTQIHYDFMLWYFAAPCDFICRANFSHDPFYGPHPPLTVVTDRSTTYSHLHF